VNPEAGCGLCRIDPAVALLSTDHAVLALPTAPHLSVPDGGHLLVATRRHVASRVDYTNEEVTEIHRLVCIAAKALLGIGWAQWINFQENGNWSVDAPCGSHSHTHVYGRSRNSSNHPFGEPLRLPTQQGLIDRPVLSVSRLELVAISAALMDHSKRR